MKIKGGYRYFARLNHSEAEIILNALELLLESYENKTYIVPEHYKANQSKNSVEKVIGDLNEGGV